MPSPFGKEKLLSTMKLSGTNDLIHHLKIVDLADAVEGRVNLVLNNGQVWIQISIVFCDMSNAKFNYSKPILDLV